MENFVISVNAILPMFLVMALGYGARCLGWIHREEISDINKVAFRIFCPVCFIIMYIARTCPARLIRC